MDKNELLEKIPLASTEIESEVHKSINENSISLGNDFEFPHGSINLIIAMEELSELQKELSKYIRGKGDVLNVTEEIADVLVSIEKIKLIMGIEDENINKIINIKMERMVERDKKLVESRERKD